MLALKRRKRESVIITNKKTGETIKVMVVCSRGNVILGFDANDNYEIRREELPTRIQAGKPSIGAA